MAFPPKIQRQIIADNLHTQERQISTALEARRSHLSDLARVLVDSLPPAFTDKHVLSSRFYFLQNDRHLKSWCMVKSTPLSHSNCRLDIA